MVAINTERIRVNGTFLQPNHGKPVCLLGTVIKADGGGSAFQLRSSDGQPITIRLKQPITEPLEGLIEVYGIAQGKSLIIADSFTTFPAEMAASFDPVAYNEFVNLINTTQTDNPWKVPS